VTGLLAVLLMLLQDPSGVIEGSVIRAGTDPPLPLINARVELTGGREPLVGRTNGSGQFSFDGLPAGAYGLSVARDGYIREVYGGQADDPGRTPIRITAGQRVDSIRFELDPAPTVSGKIQDIANKPLADIVVQALKMSYDALGMRHLTTFASTRTDDRGQYRLYWLDPGNYFIQTLPPPVTEPVRTKVASAPTYFPGFPDLDSARAIRLEAGQEASGIDVTVATQPITVVSGRVVHALTHDPVIARIRLTPAASPGFHLYEAASNPEGNFLFTAVAPGSYVVSAVSAGGLSVFSKVLVRDFDPRMFLEIGPGIALEGQMFSRQGPLTNAAGLEVKLLPVDEILQPVSAQVDASGHLVFQGIHPGRYVIDLMGLPQNHYLEAAQFGAENPLNKPLELSYAQAAQPPLQMLLADNGGGVSGTVFDDNDKTFGGALITLVPAETQGYQVHKYRVTTSDANGSFRVQSVPPGEYDLYSWQTIEPRAWLNMDFLRLYEHASVRVVIAGGDVAAASVRVIRP
jgi:protocatechuate 3,4-dioxygenase beta subunit